MRFLARLNPISGIHRDWRTRGRVSGVISGVLFRWDQSSRSYVSDEIGPGAVEAFQARQDKAVTLEALQIMPQEAEPIAQSAGEPPKRRPARRRLAE